ncbi:hypothetical protein G6F50_013789 [Rhizopus delemar]|uniref:Uncharacterized protein n=1 Tax=Rhizopus delemar TaxID=936053 RepID=A0A9P7CB45_9FUNG|nr:hypothetical protein G6F50_013789 [Rhizopus delemar]
MHVDEVGARVEVVAPHFLEQHHPGQHLPGVAHQVLQQLELGRQQAQAAPATVGGARQQVQLQVADPQHGLVAGRLLAATQQHFHPRGHLVGGERLGQVVVATGAQAAHALVHVGQRAEHQHRRGNADPPQRGADGQAVQARQQAVQRDHVIVAAGRAHQAFTTIGHPVHVQAMAAQLGHDFLGSDGVILDGQYARHGHRWSRDWPMLAKSAGTGK